MNRQDAKDFATAKAPRAPRKISLNRQGAKSAKNDEQKRQTGFSINVLGALAVPVTCVTRTRR